jgi:uncharacterized protein (DUF1697 family)
MQRYIAFLRSINVGGRRVAGNELTEIAAGCGLSNAATFLASGNLVFDAEPNPHTSRVLEKALLKELGYDVPVMLRTAEQVSTIATSDLFTTDQAKISTGKVQVSVLMAEPTAEAVQQVLALGGPDDVLVFKGAELYWLPIGNMSDSELDSKGIDRILGMRTTRTMNTMQRLTQKFLMEGSV